jgi:hypothetical protein
MVEALLVTLSFATGLFAFATTAALPALRQSLSEVSSDHLADYFAPGPHFRTFMHGLYISKLFATPHPSLAASPNFMSMLKTMRWLLATTWMSAALTGATILIVTLLDK